MGVIVSENESITHRDLSLIRENVHIREKLNILDLVYHHTPVNSH